VATTYPGKFIVLDGPEGCGKSTQVKMLVHWLKARGIEATAVRDPGSTPVSERIRQVILDEALPGMDVRTEVLLYMACRAEMVARVIRHSLSVGVTVVSDRFVSSTVAYQGYAGGFALDAISQLARVACGDVEPDVTIILDVDVATGFARIHGPKAKVKRGPQLAFQFFRDRMELKDRAYHEKVREGFLAMARERPEKFVVVDARQSPDEVARAIEEAVTRVLG
jgi:dTMP kinase